MFEAGKLATFRNVSAACIRFCALGLGLAAFAPAPAAAGMVSINFDNVALTDGGFLNGFIDYDAVLGTVGAFAVVATGVSSPIFNTRTITSADATSSGGVFNNGGNTEIYVQTDGSQIDFASIAFLTAGTIPGTIAPGDSLNVLYGTFAGDYWQYPSFTGAVLSIGPEHSVDARLDAPEPTTLAVLGVALAGVGMARRRKAAC